MNPSPKPDQHYSPERALNLGRQTLSIEAAAVNALVGRIAGEFAFAVELILGCHGRVIVSGMASPGFLQYLS